MDISTLISLALLGLAAYQFIQRRGGSWSSMRSATWLAALARMAARCTSGRRARAGHVLDTARRGERHELALG